MPGPKEPKLTMNSYLTPLVEELKSLWSGVYIPCKHHPLKRIFMRAALICCSCDIPATRKVCGFVGHNATKGCSKCDKTFPSLNGTDDHKKRDFSGFDRENWPPRHLSEHNRRATKYLNAKTKAKQKSKEKKYGIRYSVLQELPYWNPIRFAVVDPMHNLFLGTGKHLMRIWVDRGLITKRHFLDIEKIVANIITPKHTGRIPLKIASSFSGFTADQWRNWITIFSPIALKDILPANHLQCWLLFVRACWLVCTRIISLPVIEEVDHYLVLFCKRFEELYGRASCTPNLHLHLHMKDCLQDYGPVHGFWCYSFERFNGILGRYHTNNRSIEVQLMKKFLRQRDILFQALESPTEADDLLEIADNLVGSLHEGNIDYCDEVLDLRCLAKYESLHSDYSIKSDNLICLLPPMFRGVLNQTEVSHIKSVYSFLYFNPTVVHFSPFYTVSKKAVMGGELFTSGSVITAFWPSESLHQSPVQNLQVGRIQKFIKHTLKIEGENAEGTVEKKHVFAVIEWYVNHDCRSHYGASAIVCFPFTYSSSASQFMPIQRVMNCCSFGKLKATIRGTNSEDVLIAIPMHLNYCY